MKPVPSSEITSKEIYLSRKDFIKGASITALGALVLAACKGDPTPTRPRSQHPAPKKADIRWIPTAFFMMKTTRTAGMKVSTLKQIMKA